MNGFDAAVMGFVNGLSRKSWTLDTTLGILLGMNFVKGGVIVAVLWGLWFASPGGKDADGPRKTILGTFAGTLIAILLTELLVHVLPFRERPRFDHGLGILFPVFPSADAAFAISSFPSDHAAMFIGLVTGIFLVSRRLGLLSFVYVSAVVLVPRIYMGMHYPTDILAGGVLGAGIVFLATRPAIGSIVSEPFLAWSRKHPVSFYGVSFLFCNEMCSLFWNVRILGEFGLQLLRAAARRSA